MRPEPDGAPLAPIAYVIVDAPDGSQAITELPGSVEIGRDLRSDIVLPDRRVSRRHATIEVLPGDCAVVRDLDSANGTLVEDRALCSATARVDLPVALRIGPYALLVTASARSAQRTLRVRRERAHPAIALAGARRACVAGVDSDVQLSPRMRAFLAATLARFPGTASVKELGDAIWGSGRWDREMVHDVAHRLRRRLSEFEPSCGEILVSEPGEGYRVAAVAAALDDRSRRLGSGEPH